MSLSVWDIGQGENIMAHPSPDISLDIWDPPDLAKAWGVLYGGITETLASQRYCYGGHIVDQQPGKGLPQPNKKRNHREGQRNMTHVQLPVAILPERAISHRPEEDKRLQTDCQQFCTVPSSWAWSPCLPSPPSRSPPSHSTGLETLPTTTAAPGLLGPGPVALERRGRKVKRRSVGTPQQPYVCQIWGKTAQGMYLAARMSAALPVAKAA
ncbi:uncharacterized protein CLUP02_02216 [Colletotrichum lupini]|uniref:Uncharacterized protein n=1 Tax=Colletotrichum lupini TaxID=145971 RepID=A0A9Q8WAF4_9PEZI|nr:uncharacterized protein CLUP02_02216 [Colletotrichum lupini]UQC75562.1 hypothetical protein CLUP02_02216 [Colletotrichum lupini]